MWMQEGRKWHFGWNWVLHKYWKNWINDTFWAIMQVSTQSIMEKNEMQRNNEVQRKSEHKIAFPAKWRKCTYDLLAFNRRIVLLSVISVFANMPDNGVEKVNCPQPSQQRPDIWCDITVVSDGPGQPTGHGILTMGQDPLCSHGCKEVSANKDICTLILLNTTQTDQFKCVYNGLVQNYHWEMDVVVVKVIELEVPEGGDITWICPPHMNHNVSGEFFYVGCSPSSGCSQGMRVDCTYGFCTVFVSWNSVVNQIYCYSSYESTPQMVANIKRIGTYHIFVFSSDFCSQWGNSNFFYYFQNLFFLCIFGMGPHTHIYPNGERVIYLINHCLCIVHQMYQFQLHRPCYKDNEII